MLSVCCLLHSFLSQINDFDVKSMRNSSGNPWQEAHSGIQSILGSIESLLTVILIVGAIVTLSLAIGKLMKGDRDSGERFILWFAGFLIGSIFLGIVL